MTEIPTERTSTGDLILDPLEVYAEITAQLRDRRTAINENQVATALYHHLDTLAGMVIHHRFHAYTDILDDDRAITRDRHHNTVQEAVTEVLDTIFDQGGWIAHLVVRDPSMEIYDVAPSYPTGLETLYRTHATVSQPLGILQDADMIVVDDDEDPDPVATVDAYHVIYRNEDGGEVYRFYWFI